jgi:hypothetical protein
MPDSSTGTVCPQHRFDPTIGDVPQPGLSRISSRESRGRVRISRRALTAFPWAKVGFCSGITPTL